MIIPNSVTYIKFGDHYDQPDIIIPQSVKCLIFGKYYNQPVDKIPKSVIYVKFGHYFNQKINYLVDTKIQYMIFGFCFNQALGDDEKSFMPVTLLKLVLPRAFNNPLGSGKISFLPHGLKFLELSTWHHCSINNFIPLSVTHLRFHDMFDNDIGDSNGNSFIPLSVTHLSIENKRFSKPLTINNNKLIPNSVTNLVFYPLINTPCLPDSILCIKTVINFNRSCIPLSVTKISYGGNKIF